MMTTMEYNFCIFGGRLLGRYWPSYEVCEGIDNFTSCAFFNVKVYSITEIMLSSLPTTLFFVEAFYIAWCKFIQCP